MESSVETGQEPRVVRSETRSKLTIDIAGAAIFGALSIVVSQLTTASLPRMQWGIAFFDPVSLIWIAAFLIFGYRAGVLTCLIGMLGLMPFDPTPLVGPVMKFVATIGLVVIPWAYAKFATKQTPSGDNLSQLRIFVPGMTLAWIVRIILMIGLNYFYIVYVWQVPIQFLSLEWLGHAEITGFMAIAVTIFLLNTLQTLFDAIIPYIIVFKGKIYEKFKFY
jgi:riboflavin transporter FmnP